MDDMLSRISTLIDSLSRSLFPSNVEDATTDADAQLPQIWFSEIPRCSLQCLYQPSLNLGCAYLDFDCICRAFEEVANDEIVENCIYSCPYNGDQLWAPGRILDFCELLGQYIKLPHYMSQYGGLHRRQYIPRADSSGYYSYSNSYSDASYTNDPGSYSTAYEPQPSATGSTILTSTTAAITGVTTATTTTATTASSGGTFTSISTGASSPSVSTSSSSSSSLSTGAKAGIGVAVPLAVIILVLGLLWYLRRRRQNKKAFQPDTGGDNLPEVTDKSWSNKVPATLPAEADGNPLNESDSTPVFSPQPISTSSQTTGVYELSGNPTVRHPPSVMNRGGSLNRQSSQTYVTDSNNISRKAVSSSVSSTGPETVPSDLATSLENTETGSVNNTVTSLQQLSEGSKGQDGGELVQLETEMARIREQRDRLQQLHLLEEQEDQLKKQIAALKAGGSSLTSS